MWIGLGKGKGGAGCTTSALELAYAATQRGRRVALLELDPQGNATDVVEPTTRAVGIKDALASLAPTGGQPRPAPLPLAEVLVPTAWERLLVAPADRYLGNRAVDITPEGISALRNARLSGELEGIVDDVIIDLPRDIGKLSATGLLGMEYLFVAARATVWGAQGAEEMRYTASRVTQKGNPELSVAGVIVTEYDASKDSVRVLGEMRTLFKEALIEPPIPRRSRVREAIESYHTPCREYGGADLEEVADRYQKIYDDLLKKVEGK
ncbi:ParA family protein [Streptomyces lunalinharesii]|uniref:ParA family protein n=1 Tax=Streptomyces lunalinharesii TaxID=333384 RepID=UPI0031DDA7C3